MITVFVNKLLLNSEYFNLDAPLFVTWSQCVVSTIICYSMGRLSKWKPGLVRFPTGNPLDMRTIKNVSAHFSFHSSGGSYRKSVCRIAPYHTHLTRSLSNDMTRFGDHQSS